MRMLDNSTKYTGRLIEQFLLQEYPEISEVQLLHSTTNLFRYDENIVFVKRQLLPLVDGYRDKLFAAVGSKWRDCMRVSLSFADGSSARISAINASLRHYRPTYMHFWQLKTFWRENKICEDDIELHSYQEVDTEPAISLRESLLVPDPQVQLVVAEMAAYRAHFAEVVGDPLKQHDLTSFWLRKTGKVVLAVLLVHKPGSAPKLYRGMNMEVAMSTGSLCAERNVIGSALADDVTLRRQDMKFIAVYSATLPNKRPLRPEEGGVMAAGPKRRDSIDSAGSGSSWGEGSPGACSQDPHSTASIPPVAGGDSTLHTYLHT